MNTLQNIQRTWRAGLIGVTLLSLSAAPIHSQDESDSKVEQSTAKVEEPISNAEEATPELQARWEHFAPVPIPATKSGDSPTLVI